MWYSEIYEDRVVHKAYNNYGVEIDSFVQYA